MAESEKITINMGIVDLGRIDLLVEEGFYNNRTDFIRTAIRNQLERHSKEVASVANRHEMVIGTLIYDRKDLEAFKAHGKKLKIKVIGLFFLGPDITPELALETIESVVVHGVFKAPADVKAALTDRLK